MSSYFVVIEWMDEESLTNLEPGTRNVDLGLFV